MVIEKNKSVSFDYKLTSDAGKVIDSSAGKEPLSYIHGHGALISGLEKALEGHSAGSKLEVIIAPEDAYGVYDAELMHKIPIEVLAGSDKIEVGMHLELSTKDGGTSVVQVKEISKKHVVVDANHPLAGQNLNFSVEVRDVRDADSEELSKVKNDCACCDD